MLLLPHGLSQSARGFSDFLKGFCSRCSSLASWGLMGVFEMTALLLRRQCFAFFSVRLHIVLTEANKASCLAALHQTSCDKRFDIVFLELVLLCFAENQGIKFDANLVRSLLGSRPELRTIVDLFCHRGRFLNRLIESGDTCHKYMGCTSGLAAGSVIHGGEGLVGPYCAGWQLNARGPGREAPGHTAVYGGFDRAAGKKVSRTVSWRLKEIRFAGCHPQGAWCCLTAATIHSSTMRLNVVTR